MRRVAVTGIGAVSPVGIGRTAFWDSVLGRRSRFSRISRFDPISYSCQVAGQVDDASVAELVDPRKARTAPHATQLALAAGELVLRDSRLAADRLDPATLGVSLGTAVGGWADAEKQCAVLAERGARRVNPFIASGAGNHGPGAELASFFGAQGPQTTFSSGCPSSLQALGHAASLVASGMVDLCVAGGTESPINPLTFASLGRTHELSTETLDPQRASRPFDRNHCGMVLSEGSCLLLLESFEAAEARGATVYAEVLGFSSSCDARGLYGFDETGKAGARAIDQLLRRCAVSPAEIDYVCAHANSSPAFDHKEVGVLAAAMGEFLARIPVSSIKGVLGHPFGASGAFQAAATAMAIRDGRIPPTHNLDEPDTACRLNHVAGQALESPIRKALITSYGYGGVNAYLLLGAVA